MSRNKASFNKAVLEEDRANSLGSGVFGFGNSSERNQVFMAKCVVILKGFQPDLPQSGVSSIYGKKISSS